MTEKQHYQRVVIKVGTSTLTDGGTELSLARMVDLVRQIIEVKTSGTQVLLVSSGGIAAGREMMGYPDVPRFLPAKQMLAAVGQPRLMAIYTQLFKLYRQEIAQVLLTRDDLVDRRRYLNARNTLEALLEYDIVPIINENDTIATEEIRFGDNDNLSALIANVLEADLLLLLTDQEGVFTADPRKDPQAELVSRIETETIPPQILEAAQGSQTGLGTGGMISKLSAAELARRSGSAVIVAKGSKPQVISKIVRDGQAMGTYFSPLTTHLESRKRFLLSGLSDATGILRIDRGAVKALRKGGSLLPVGIVEVSGTFTRGLSVAITGPKDESIAVGLCNYSAEDIRQIAGHQSDRIESILGYAYRPEVVHHNKLVLF